ncbi:MAG TPA: GFA family protein [Polyangiaceae bacterium]|jgi:hypothetical protein
MARERYEGGCHCERVRFVVHGDLATVSACNCSICTKKGFIHLIVPREDFELFARDADVASYEFNTKTAKHRFCRVCGIHSFYVPRSDPDKIDVNVRCLENVDLTKLAPSHFDGRNWEQAIHGDLSWR